MLVRCVCVCVCVYTSFPCQQESFYVCVFHVLFSFHKKIKELMMSLGIHRHVLA